MSIMLARAAVLLSIFMVDGWPGILGTSLQGSSGRLSIPRSVLRNLAIDCRRPGTSLRSTGAVTIAAVPTRRSRCHHRSHRPSSIVAPNLRTTIRSHDCRQGPLT